MAEGTLLMYKDRMDLHADVTQILLIASNRNPS